MASIFNLTENKDATPLSIVDSKVELVEHITRSSKSTTSSRTLQLPEKLESPRLHGPDFFFPRCFIDDSSGAYKLIQECW